MSIFILSSFLQGIGNVQGNLMRTSTAIKSPRKTPLVGKLVSLFLLRGFCESFFVAGQDFTSIGPLGGRYRTIRKILVSVKFVSAILGPEMAAPILWAPGKMRSGKPMSIKFLVFGGGGVFWLGGGGGSADFIFMRAGIFLKQDACSERSRKRLPQYLLILGLGSNLPRG